MQNSKINYDMKNIFITVVLTVVSLTTFAKDNFKMTGRIDGAGNDTLCIEYVILQPKKQVITHKVAVKNGEFSFSAKLREAYFGSMFLKSNPQEILYTYFVPDEEAVLSGRLNSVEEHWDGTAFYQQYGRIMSELEMFSVRLTLSLPLPELSQTA